jgi:hypothetical protein
MKGPIPPPILATSPLRCGRPPPIRPRKPTNETIPPWRPPHPKALFSRKETNVLLRLTVSILSALLAVSLFGQAEGAFSVASYRSIQDAIDRNPHLMVFVPAGDHFIGEAIRITTANAGLWGPRRIIQTNPEAALVEIEGASSVQLRDLTFTRAKGKMETLQPGIHVRNSAGVTLANVQVLDNWGNRASVLAEHCPAFQIRDCLIQNPLMITGPETSDFIQVIGNYVENAAQGIDIHADHVILADNIVNNAFIGMKATHGARNVIVRANQFSKIDLWGINLVPGGHSHFAEAATPERPAAGPRALISKSLHHPVRYADANVDGYSIVANNMISDFGYGHAYWIWNGPESGLRPAPLRFDATPFPKRPRLTDVMVQGNMVYDPGRDQILVDGGPRVMPPRYDAVVRLGAGERGPRGVSFDDNIFHPGTKGDGLSAQSSR